MAEHLKIERYQWFDQQVRSGNFPNGHTLARHFELSDKTARRNIEFMRDRLGAPLEYDMQRKGYFYADDSFSLPSLQATQNELLAILLARNLLSESAGGFISREIASFGLRLFSTIGAFGLSRERIDEAFSSNWNGHTPTESAVFGAVADALLQQRVIRFDYHSPRHDGESIRLVEPHHLQHYLGSWMLIAFCRTAGDWRKFNLSRMAQLHTPGETFPLRPRSEWGAQLEGAFGIFQGTPRTEVVLHFTSHRARWIRQQHWHVDQRIEEQPDGGLHLSFPVADFREIKLRILQFGAEVEVLEPPDLRKEIEEEIVRMVQLYGK
jgi:predicted DNA-binding transcriptional regulator YafY